MELKVAQSVFNPSPKGKQCGRSFFLRRWQSIVFMGLGPVQNACKESKGASRRISHLIKKEQESPEVSHARYRYLES